MEIVELFEKLEGKRYSGRHIEGLIEASVVNDTKSSSEIKRNPIIIATIVVLLVSATLVVYNYHKKAIVKKDNEQLKEELI